MKGVLLLSEGRSGSHWLGSLINGTGILGRSAEWFSPHGRDGEPTPETWQDMVSEVLKWASTPNGFFAIKLFPVHVHWINQLYGVDLVKYFTEHHDVRIIRLERRDRFRQAISYSRGIQTQQWTADTSKRADAAYDFDMVCRCFFFIGRSYDYWNSYCMLRDLDSLHFVYEDLVGDPRPFVDAVAAHAGVEVAELQASKYSIQRDQVTEEWLTRFRQDLSERNAVNPSTPSRPAKRTISNLIRLLKKEQLKPYPYEY